MAKTMQCNVVSAEESIFEGSVSMLIAAGTEGDLGITPGHAPLITGLQPGPVRVVMENGEEDVFYVSGGYLEVVPSAVTVLADTALRAHDLDEAAALEAQERVRKEMAEQSAEFDYGRAQMELAEAAGRLRVLQQLKRRSR
ncbi:MAG: F0F1 ATP synthase subunit epsilon [Pseudomonadales bacterium]